MFKLSVLPSFFNFPYIYLFSCGVKLFSILKNILVLLILWAIIPTTQAQNVGIGTATPSEKLHVVGNLRFDGALMPNGNAGTSGQVLVSQGAGTPPQWQTLPNNNSWYLYHVDCWGAGSTDPGTQGWSGANTSNCGGQWLLGGYNQCGSGCSLTKTFTGLPAHSEVLVKVYWWSIDSWDLDSGSPGVDHSRLQIDGSIVGYSLPSFPFGGTNNNRAARGSGFCGGGWLDYGPQLLVGKAAHTSSSLSISIDCLVNQAASDESMGVQMVEIWLKP